jgi:hypothetical protein
MRGTPADFEHLHNVRRTAERGRAEALRHGRSGVVDTFQHQLDELHRAGISPPEHDEWSNT